MRFVKLFICFAVFLAVIVAVVYFSKGVGTKGLNGVDNEYVQEYDSIINARWGEDAVWSSERFEDFKSELNAMKGEFGNGYKTLVNTLDRLALDRLYDATINEYAKPGCEKRRIDELTSDLETYFSAEKNEKVGKLRELNKFYNNALNLSKKKFGYRTNYNKSECSWNNIDKYIRDQEKVRKEIIDNQLYDYIRTINEVNSGLNQSTFNSKLDDCRAKFKSNLAGDIYNGFRNDIPRYVTASENLQIVRDERNALDSTYSQLGNTIDKFKGSFGSDDSLTNLLNELKQLLYGYDELIERLENSEDDL